MKSRIPCVAAVVGALLIGGATTGGTFASWKDTAKQTGDSITAGALDFDRSPTSDSMSVVAGGSPVTRLITVTDKSLGKTLVRRIRPLVSAGTGLQANVFTVSGGACTTTPAGDFSGAQGATYQLCLSVRSPAGTSAATATATLSLVAQQTRLGSDYGWFVTKTVPVTVTITNPTILNCGTQAIKNEMPVTWSNPPGVTKAEVQTATTETGSYSTMTGGTSTPAATSFTITQTTVGSLFYRIKFTGGSVPTSNVLKITRDNNNGNSNLTYCGAP